MLESQAQFGRGMGSTNGQKRLRPDEVGKFLCHGFLEAEISTRGMRVIAEVAETSAKTIFSTRVGTRPSSEPSTGKRRRRKKEALYAAEGIIRHSVVNS